MAITPTANEIRAAAEQLGALEPPWRERYQTGGQLLINGGWNYHTQFLTFPGGIVCQHEVCTCQEGRAIVCPHRVALMVLEHAAGWPAAA